MTEPTAVLDHVRDAWGWTGLEPCQIIRQNEFGNLIVADASGAFWRIRPEDLECEIIAVDQKQYDRIASSAQFDEDFHMQPLVRLAENSLGQLSAGEKYCLKIPSVLGGSYGIENIAKITYTELISASGGLAQQIKDFPDGAQVELKVID